MTTSEKKKHPQTVVEAMNDLTATINECGRLIEAEVVRTVKKINAIWARHAGGKP